MAGGRNLRGPLTALVVLLGMWVALVVLLPAAPQTAPLPAPPPGPSASAGAGQ